MKNNFIKITVIIIIILSFFQNSFSEDFNFNVTEMQIFENGNLIKGINGGTVTSSNNIVIVADNFEYNKLTYLLKAKGNVKLIDTDQSIIIESNEIFYQKDKEIIYTNGVSKANNSTNIEITAEKYFKYSKSTSLLEAKGNVSINDSEKDIIIKTNNFFYLKNNEKFFTKGDTKVFIQKRYTVDTKDLIFLRNQNLLSSTKETFIEDSTLNNIYKLINFEYSVDQEILKGNQIEVIINNKKDNSDKFFFETGFFNFKENKFLAKDVNIKFHKTLFDDNKNDPRVNSISAYGDEFNTFFEKGVFTSCKKTDKCPPWKITSNKIHHDKIKKQVIYKDAWLEIYDFPVVYFPKFFHPDPSVKRQSGFLKPELGSSQNLGSSIYTPYFYILSKDSDITFKPKIFGDKKFLLQNEYRKKTKNSMTLADFSLLKGHDSSQDDKGDTRSHFFSNTIVDLSLESYKSSILEVNYQKTSNDNYLKLFNLESPLLLQNNDVLESIIKLDLNHKDYNLTTSFEMYETLKGSSSDRYQYVLPAYDFSKNFNLKNTNGSFNFNSYGNNTLSNTNITTSTLSNDLKYSAINSFFDNGIKTNFEIFLKNINTVGKNSPQYKESPQLELMSAYTYNASLPLIKRTEKNIKTLEPKISFRLSPHDMKNNKSLGRRIDVNNIFNSNRLSMSNSFEEGESATLGLNFKKEKVYTKNKITEIEEYLDFKLATVFRLNDEDNIPINSTLNKKKSNVFGQFSFKPIKNILLNYNFSLTEDLNTFEYNSLTASANFDNFTSQFNYLEERGVIGQTNVIENTTSYFFNEENSLSLKTRRNQKINLTEYYDLVYEYKNDCLVASIQYKKNYYNDADIKPLEELFFSITIVPLTTFSPDKMVLK
tara:strand:- start:2621 stop:5254 length:2634 start_codon:yes stop_codon:yes gene_type:complete